MSYIKMFNPSGVGLTFTNHGGAMVYIPPGESVQIDFTPERDMSSKDSYVNMYTSQAKTMGNVIGLDGPIEMEIEMSKYDPTPGPEPPGPEPPGPEPPGPEPPGPEPPGPEPPGPEPPGPEPPEPEPEMVSTEEMSKFIEGLYASKNPKVDPDWDPTLPDSDIIKSETVEYVTTKEVSDFISNLFQKNIVS